MPSSTTERAVDAVIRFFRWDPWAAFHAAWTHVPDERGSCAGCHSQLRAVTWPCIVADCAQRAIELSDPCALAQLALSATLSPDARLPPVSPTPIRTTKEGS